VPEVTDQTTDNAMPAAVWPVFGDLMAGVAGIFVLLVVWVLGFQLELAESLEQEITKREVEQERRMELERALEGPLTEGRITFTDGRIGISGSVLFGLNSVQLQPEGEALLTSLVKPLQIYLRDQTQVLMISGFTDDLAIQPHNRRFRDNWDLSAQRALTVTRVLIENGLAPSHVFAAAFGAEQPVASNDTEQGRAQNRRVEIAPIPRAERHTSDANAPPSDAVSADMPSVAAGASHG